MRDLAAAAVLILRSFFGGSKIISTRARLAHGIHYECTPRGGKDTCVLPKRTRAPARGAPAQKNKHRRRCEMGGGAGSEACVRAMYIGELRVRAHSPAGAAHDPHTTCATVRAAKTQQLCWKKTQRRGASSKLMSRPVSKRGGEPAKRAPCTLTPDHRERPWRTVRRQRG